MTLIGLDLNATRARAIQGEISGSGPQAPLALPLDGDERELPLALSLEERHPRVGRAGASLCRRSPHLACVDFLPYLGDGRLWIGGRHRLDAAGALALVCAHLQHRFGRAEGVTVTPPAYFSAAQAALLADVAGRARWRLLGSVPAPVAAALAAHVYLPWSGQAVVIDLDGAALILSAVSVRDDQVHLRHVHLVPRLGRGVWLGRLLDGAALRCIRLSRRDPRESAETEQALFDQLSAVLDSGGEEPAEMVLQTPHWYQHLQFSPTELSVICAPLVERTLAEIRRFLADIAELDSIGTVLLTGSAARLPGLTAAIEEQILQPDAMPPLDEENADFGEGLIDDNGLPARVHVLDDDAVARAAFDVALRQQRGDLPHGHLDGIALPRSAADDRGPTRLPFRGAS